MCHKEYSGSHFVVKSQENHKRDPCRLKMSKSLNNVRKIYFFYDEIRLFEGIKW